MKEQKWGLWEMVKWWSVVGGPEREVWSHTAAKMNVAAHHRENVITTDRQLFQMRHVVVAIDALFTARIADAGDHAGVVQFIGKASMAAWKYVFDSLSPAPALAFGF